MLWENFVRGDGELNNQRNIRRLSVVTEVVLLAGQRPLMTLLRQMGVSGQLTRGLLNFPLQVMPLEMLLLLVLALP